VRRPSFITFRHYERNLQTKAGELRMRVPKLSQQTFETATIERYRRREISVEETLIEMYVGGISVRRVEDITEALWGAPGAAFDRVAAEQEDLRTLEAWRPIEGEHPYFYRDGIVLKRNSAGEVRNISLLVAFGVNSAGYWEILGICEPSTNARESHASEVIMAAITRDAPKVQF
jgi:putative transposase